MPGPSGTGGGVSSTVPFELNDTSDNLLLSITKSGTGTTRITAPQDDLALRSARDIILYPGDDGPGNVFINWGDAEMTPNSSNRVATIGDIESGTTGDITFDGVQIIGAGTASGDGQSNSTIEIVPDADLYANDQYLIIDPTNPNHIHIRAGGTQDDSNADLILGGERNNVYIEDDARSVSIFTRPTRIENTYVNDNLTSSTTFLTTTASDISTDYVVNVDGTDYTVDSVNSNSPSEGLTSVTASGAVFTAGASYVFTYEPFWNNYWNFNSNGYLLGPAMGGLFVTGILNNQSDLYLQSSDHDVIISSYNGGEYLGDSSNPENQIATIGYVNTSKGSHARVLASDGSPLTGALSHIGKLLYANLTETASEFTVPTNASVAFPIGSEIKFATSDESSWHIFVADGQTTNVFGEGSGGYSALNQSPFIVPINSTATLLKVDTDKWILSGLRLTD